VPYISHPVAVASILAKMRLDSQTLIAAILHDTIEDTEVAREDVATEFGESVAALVDGVSKLDQLKFRSREEAQAESFRKLMLAMSDDVRVIIIKLGDRLHNMRTLGSLKVAKKRRIARETLDIYAPLAHRLGMHEIKNELEKLGLKALYPDRYRVIKEAIQKTSGTQKQSVKDASKNLKKLMQKAKIKARIESRKKEIFSVYRKMQDQKLPLRDIVDIFGIRIVVNSVDECYRVLGLVHTRYRPMLGKFKDYIAIPKQNGYQSLHTTVLGPKGMPLEVQIRTKDMHSLAEAGIAAHWHYKDKSSKKAAPQVRAREWIHSLVSLNDETGTEGFVEDVKTDLFPGKVFVFTPKGRIIRLARASTPIDFAYAIHTDVGHKCIGARVDRRMVALSTKLENGQTVEIVTDKKSKPNPAWLNFVATPKARHSIRNYIKSLTDTGAEDLGKRMLDRALRNLGSSLKKITRASLQELANEYELERKRDLFIEIGFGQRLAPLVAQRLVPVKEVDEIEDTNNQTLTIRGTEGLVITYGKCCHPLPGDQIIGYLTTGRGIVIHRDTCGNLVEYRNQPARWLEVTWEEQLKSEFLCELKILTNNEPGVLASVSTHISKHDTNIASVSLQTKDDDLSYLIFQFYVRDLAHLQKIQKDVAELSFIINIERS